jgi:hypothetical protein
MPVTPITDMTIKENDLVIATQGRAFYILDDLSVLQQLNKDLLNKNLHVFAVNPSWRIRGSRFRGRGPAPVNAGANPAGGVVMNYYLKEAADSTKLSVSIYDKNKKLVKSFGTDSKDNKIEIKKGMNQFNWDLLYPEAERADGMILWNGSPSGIVAPPGNYFARFKSGNDSSEVSFSVKADPNYKITQEDYEGQFAFLQQVQDKFNEVQKGIKDLRAIRTQINDFTGRQGKDMPKEVKVMADSINKQLTAIEETLYQTKAKSSQDVLNYPIRLNDKLSGIFDVASSGYSAPSRQVKEAYAELAAQSDVELSKLKKIIDEKLPAFNKLIIEKSLPVITVKKE